MDEQVSAKILCPLLLFGRRTGKYHVLQPKLPYTLFDLRLIAVGIGSDDLKFPAIGLHLRPRLYEVYKPLRIVDAAQKQRAPLCPGHLRGPDCRQFLLLRKHQAVGHLEHVCIHPEFRHLLAFVVRSRMDRRRMADVIPLVRLQRDPLLKPLLPAAPALERPSRRNDILDALVPRRLVAHVQYRHPAVMGMDDVGMELVD